MMPHQADRPSRESQLSVFSSLIFHHAVAFLLLTHTHGGESQQIGQRHPVVAMVGDDVTLPCHVNPAKDAVNVMLEWVRPDLTPRFVHVRRFGKDHLVDQNPSYKGRTSASIDRLKQGDVSLKLSKVHLSDEGTYKCSVRELNTDSSVQLVVDVVPEVTKVSSGVLQCKSKGWYPESEVIWLDAEGNLLPGGPTETVRGPDGLYAVSSRVTVEKKHSNSFTCRVQQKNTNQIRETQFHVPDDFLTDSPCSSAPSIAIGLVVGVMFTLAVAFVVWRLRHKPNVDEGTPRGGDPEKESLIGEGTMKNQNGTEDGNNTQSLSKETKYQVEAETQQEKLRTEGLTGRQEDRQSEHADSGSQCVMESGRQGHEVQAGGQTVNDLDKRDEKTEETEPEKREEKTEKEEDGMKPEEDMKSLNPQTEGHPMDGGGQQQAREGGQATHETDKEEQKEQTQGAGVGETRQNDPPAGGGTKNETETNSTEDKDAVCPDEGGQQEKNRDDDDETTKSSNSTRAEKDAGGGEGTSEEPCPPKTETQPEKLSTEGLTGRQEDSESKNAGSGSQCAMDKRDQRTAETDPEKREEKTGEDKDGVKPGDEIKSSNNQKEGLMDGGGQQQTREGGQATHETDKEEQKEQTQGAGVGETRQNDPPAGEGTKNKTETNSTEDTEGQQEKNRDKANGGEDTQDEIKSSNPHTEGLMDGGGQQQTRGGEAATHDTEDNQEQTGGGGTKNETKINSTEEKNACPDEGEGQKKNRDKANGGENTTLEENTTPQCLRARDDSDENNDDEKTNSANSTRAGKDGGGAEGTSEEPCPPKTETQPEKSPDSRDGDEDIQPPGEEGHRGDGEELPCQTEV